MLYSVIVPVYNRPDEIRELLESLVRQTYQGFEVIIVEDGSEKKCKCVVSLFTNKLNLSYYEIENGGQGFARNFGFEKARGDYLVVFDSDCILPENYFEKVTEVLRSERVDCWGGPDRAHDSFSEFQKAINYSMTSLFTTGGIRGRKKHLGNYHPRSFNMGISREVYLKTGGYRITRMGEDIEFSIRITESGFRIRYIDEAFVYHKRRATFSGFYRQLYFFGRARINIGRFYRNQVQLVHWLPVTFTAGFYTSLVLAFIPAGPFSQLLLIYILYALLVFGDSLMQMKHARIALLSVATSYIQLVAYGNGFIKEWFRFHLLRQREPKQG